MLNNFKALGIAMLLATTTLLSACGGSDSPTQAVNVVEAAKDDPKFALFSEAIKAADLEQTLAGPGPYTVFAPTNEAFLSLLSELGISKARMLGDKAFLTRVLTYHVLAANVKRADVPLGKPITSIEGGIFKIDAIGSDLVITDGRNRTAKIVKTDIEAGNGVLHAIDKVLLPANQTIVETAQAAPQFSILVEAVVAAGLVDTLNGSGPFTVFAPTNDAFAALLGELGITKEALLADTPLLTKVLTYHVLPGRVLKAEVPVGTPIQTVQGETFTVDAGLNITDQRGRVAAISATDIFASNGVIHVLDKVVLPAP